MDEVIKRTPPGGENNVLLTVREAYMKLKISKSKLYDLFHKGQVEFIKIGRRTLVPQSSVDEYILKRWQESFA